MNSALQNTAAQIAAAALFESYPELQLIEGGEDSFGFYYRFYYPHPFYPQMAQCVEDKMLAIAVEKRCLKILEMVPWSASELLKSRGFEDLAHALEGEGLVQILSMGPFYNQVFSPLLTSTEEVRALKILSIQEEGEKVFVLKGVAASSKEELKAELKRLKSYQKHRHLKRGEDLGYWSVFSQEIIWRSAGLSALEELFALFKTSFSFCLELASFSEDSSFLFQWLEKRQNEPILERKVIPCKKSLLCEEGLLSLTSANQLRVGWIETETHNLISLLQLTCQTLNMLDFSYSLEGTVPARKKALQGENWGPFQVSRNSPLCLQFLGQDGLGRKWEIATVKPLPVCKEGYSLTFSIEKILALLLEKSHAN